MKIGGSITSRVILPAALAALPAVLLFTSVRTLQEIDAQRTVYLRHRVALLAGRLENLPASASPEAIFETLGADEPNLIGVHVIERGTESDIPALEPIWNGRELFRTEFVAGPGERVLRAHVPFHLEGKLRIARIELAGSAADFLVVHARHNVIVSSVGGLVFVALSIVALWAVRRAERMRLRQIEIEHLAQIGKMSAVLAHEIRNPLGTIKGFVQLARESGDGRTTDLLAPALGETERLEALVNDLLAYGRPPRAEPKVVSWNEVARNIRAHGQQFAGARPVRVSVQDAEIELVTDAALLGQALLNLVRNAVEAIPEDATGEVRIEAGAGSGGGAAIRVSDDGPGISDEALARLFEPFFTTKTFGTGLGLATTRKIVESLGGTLEVRRLARGTEALIRLEAKRPAAATAG